MKNLLILLLAMFIDCSSAPAYAGAEEVSTLLSDEEMDAATAAGYTFAITGSAKNLGVPRDVNPTTACGGGKCGAASPATVTLPKGVQGSIWVNGGKASIFRK